MKAATAIWRLLFWTLSPIGIAIGVALLLIALGDVGGSLGWWVLS